MRTNNPAAKLLIGAYTAAAIRIPDYWNDSRYQGTWTWAKANEPRYGNETGWWESTPAGYNGQDIFHDSVIAAQEATYDNQNIVQPHLLQLDSEVEIPDYWNDARYGGVWTWGKANEPRYGNETSWWESTPAGYNGQDIFHASVIAAQEAQYDQSRIVQPHLLQLEAETEVPDYWNDERYQPTWTWSKANEPRYGNETAWAESSPAGYKEQDIFNPSVIAATEAQWDQTNTNQPFLVQVSNQENLYRQMSTYPEADSNSYIAPYVSPAWTVTADAEGTLPHYDVYNETHWVDQSMVDGYKIPITADDGNSFAQRKTYPEADSNSYIAPYVVQDHAWTVSADAEGTLPHYDVYNETHWVDQSMVDGYKIPITADDGNSLVQKKHRTYPEADSNSYIAPYVSPAWTVTADAEGTLPHYDVYNETHWVDQSMVDGYKIPITADDADSLVQRKSKRVSHAALAQVATKVPTTGDESWLCDVRGEDGKPFYVANYDEYHHCASMFRVTADDNLHHAPASMAQITGVRVSNQALAQVATMTKVPTTGDVNWLCDVRGDDGKPFYLQSYGEYAHCAELGRMNTNDILH